MGRPVALITGAAGDIGSAVATALAPVFDLALVDHPAVEAKLAAIAESLQPALDHAEGRPVWTATFDVVDAEQVGVAVDECCRDLGVPAALFNNAGVQGAFAPIDRYPLVDATTVIMVNVVGAFHMLSVVGDRMAQAGAGGAIVNSASMAGVSGAPNMSAYSASKAAIIGLTKSAAKDLAPAGIRVNAVSPAFIGPGAMWDRQVQAQAEAGTQYFPADEATVAEMMIGSVPLRRFGSTAEVADAVAYLLSDASSYVTGVNLEVNGGAA